MSKDDVIEFEGVVEEAMRNATFKVRLTNGLVITAYISGKLRMNYIKILPGDSVTVAMSPYDLTKGRITWRSKKITEEIRYEGQTKRKTDVRQMQNHQKKRQSYGYLLQVS